MNGDGWIESTGAQGFGGNTVENSAEFIFPMGR